MQPVYSPRVALVPGGFFGARLGTHAHFGARQWLARYLGALDSHKLHSRFLQGDDWFTLDFLKREFELSCLTGVSDDQSHGLDKPPNYQS